MRLLFLIALLAGCSSLTPWKFDAITAGNPSFDSTRLTYADPLSTSPLQLELIRSQEQISCFLSLNRFRFHPPTVKVELFADDPLAEETLPVIEGSMRLRLSPSLTQHLISSLQEGKKVRILVDGFEETFLPEQFEAIYKKWGGHFLSLENLWKGPIE